VTFCRSRRVASLFPIPMAGVRATQSPVRLHTTNGEANTPSPKANSAAPTKVADNHENVEP
jgi:hypothetical protein